MHRSRLGALVIDCRNDDLDADARFWAGALGMPAAETARGARNPRYRRLEDRPDAPRVLLQQVEHEPRVHLDIETDDVEAEAARLEALGARRLERVQGWWVMEAPTGHRFCVIPVQSSRGGFDEHARVWR